MKSQLTYGPYSTISVSKLRTAESRDIIMINAVELSAHAFIVKCARLAEHQDPLETRNLRKIITRTALILAEDPDGAASKHIFDFLNKQTHYESLHAYEKLLAGFEAMIMSHDEKMRIPELIRYLSKSSWEDYQKKELALLVLSKNPQYSVEDVLSIADTRNSYFGVKHGVRTQVRAADVHIDVLGGIGGGVDGLKKGKGMRRMKRIVNGLAPLSRESRRALKKMIDAAEERSPAALIERVSHDYIVKTTGFDQIKILRTE